jgi:spermidine synthase
MKPTILLDSAAVPGGGELHLYQHDQDFIIRSGRDELMNSRAHDSEEAMATVAGERQGARADQRILIGGLGMGFTTAAARICVAELVPAVVAWNRGPLAALSGHALDDPRVSVYEGDVCALIRDADAAYDQILLDVDNGPAAMCASSNNWLYKNKGLAAAQKALRPGGVLAIWSAVPDDAFTQRLEQCGYIVDCVHQRAHRKRGTHHYIWFASKL